MVMNEYKINVTKEAILNIKRLQKEYSAINWGLRFGIKGGGCSGYKYILEFEKDSNTNDIIYKFDIIKIYVSNDHIEKLKNSIIGWKDSLMESGFDIENPQAKRACGCGESIDFK
jgi:iron-sulfur cluster assembly protein